MIQKFWACLRGENYGGFIILWHRALFRHAEVHASVIIGSIHYYWNLMELLICFRIFNLFLTTKIQKYKTLDCSAKNVQSPLTSNLRHAKRICKLPLTSMTLRLPTYAASCSDIFCAVVHAMVCIWPQYLVTCLLHLIVIVVWHVLIVANCGDTPEFSKISYVCFSLKID